MAFFTTILISCRRQSHRSLHLPALTRKFMITTSEIRLLTISHFLEMFSFKYLDPKLFPFLPDKSVVLKYLVANTNLRAFIPKADLDDFQTLVNENCFDQCCYFIQSVLHRGSHCLFNIVIRVILSKLKSAYLKLNCCIRWKQFQVFQTVTIR